MRLFLMTALMAVFCYPVYGATISAESFGVLGIDAFRWEQVNNDDDTAEVKLKRGGLWELSIEGTESNVDLKLQHGKTSGALEDIDTDTMPDGVRFTSAATGNKAKVCLSEGFVDIVFSSAGGADQDIDIWLSPLGNC